MVQTIFGISSRQGLRTTEMKLDPSVIEENLAQI